MTARRSSHYEVRLGQDGEHSGQRAARCDPPVLAAPGGKMSSLQVATAAGIFVRYMLTEEENDEKDSGGKRVCTERGLCTEVPVCLQF